MTNEEAITIIEHRDSIMDYYESKQLGEALDIAVEALKTQPCENAVSREDIKKIAKEMYLEVGNMKLDVHTISDCISYTASRCRQVLVDKLNNLPPVTPKPLTGHWIDDCPMMTDEGLVRVIRCSHCNEQRKDYYSVSKNYCPKCGAKMEGE